MELCLMIEGQEGVTWEHWRGLARTCEEHGVPSLFRSDHYMNLDGLDPSRVALDAWATISALAAVTSKLRLGTMVSPASFRHPSVLAKMVATADQVSGGRIDLGLGAGWHEGEHSAYGFPFLPVKDRVDVLEEQLQIVLGSWADGPFSFDGDHYTLKDLDARPKPVQQPHPPLIMGGNAAARSSRLAARYADEYNTPFPTITDVKERKARIDEACDAAGRGPIPFSIMTGYVVGATEPEYEDRMRARAEKMGTDPAPLLADPPESWITGTLDQASEQLAALSDAGVSRVMCQHYVHEDLEAVALLGSELAPRVA
jgi:F420-dependent oxidoreductase-like protein